MSTHEDPIHVEDLILADDLRTWAVQGGPREAKLAADVIVGCKTHAAAVRVQAETLAIMVERSLERP
jgi:hypothetical protein